MRLTGFLLLILLAGLAGAGAYYMVLAKEGQPKPTISDGQPLFPEFGAAANRVTQIELVDQEEQLNIQLKEGTWRLIERGGYGVKLEAIKKLALSVAELRIEEQKTAKAENHERLGLLAPDAEGSNSKLLTFRAADGSVLASLVVGDSKYRSGSEGVFIRRAGEDQSWLCTGRVQLPLSAKDWLDTKLIKLDKERVSSLHIVHAGGQELSIERSSETPSQFDLINVPLGRKLASKGNASSAATALASLDFDDVRPLEAIDFEKDPVAESTYRCKDGLVLKLSSARQESKTWFKLNAFYVAPAELALVEAAEGADAAEAELAAQADGPDVQAEVAMLNERLGPWAFALPGYKADQIAKPLEDLLESLQGEDSTPDLQLGPDGKLPMDLQELLNRQEGSFVPKQTLIKAQESAESIIEDSGLMDEHDHNNGAHEDGLQPEDGSPLRS